jgi:hypothetical protein
MTTEADALVRRYLDDLELELRDVPASRRRELVDEMREHIRESLAETGESESEVRALLDRLGDPAALGFTGAGWLVGVALLWTSRRWTTNLVYLALRLRD